MKRIFFFFAALVFGGALNAWTADAQEFLFKIPQQPSFVNPWGVAVAPDGAIWVAAIGASQVIKFDPNSSTVPLVLGSRGRGDGADG